LLYYIFVLDSNYLDYLLSLLISLEFDYLID